MSPIFMGQRQQAKAALLRWQVPGDLLRSAKYTCSVPDALAQDMAQRLGLNLQQYVH